ncbi:Hsp20/alpha crystallin family protein [Puniceicoccaceae bacterium K14]|nr:Hsp20/alpha crystallin family protein [Puniceicoccaceae bacterium K14]
MASTNLQKNENSTVCSTESSARKNVATRPAYKISEEKESYKVVVELPGVPRSGVNVVVEDGNLKISGERVSTASKDWKRLSGGTVSGYSLTLSLGEEVDQEQIEASVENGVLELALAKKAEKQPRSIKVS